MQNFSGNLRNTITNNILKLPVILAGAFFIFQDGVKDGHNDNTSKILWQKVYQRLSILMDIKWMTETKSIKIWPLKMDENWVISRMASIVRKNRENHPNLF